ncbi:MAG: diphosphomevalonate decarboxylase [Saprospiraceae bacterium]|nr:diphosphomevalonate decarboxylase [Saprospiraceae bacterium]
MFENPKLTVVSNEVAQGEITWRSPSNLALIKYWGKYGVQMPRNPSISFTLEHAFSDTTLTYIPRTDISNEISLKCYFHGEFDQKLTEKLTKYFSQLTPYFPFITQFDFEIDTLNTFPKSAGIASSASGMSAIALCLCSMEDALFHTLGDDTTFDQKASYIARLGSGSACRSIYPKAALWGETSEIPHSSDYYAISCEEYLHPIYQHFHNDILIVSSDEKNVSSSAGHALMDGNVYANDRYQQARQRLFQLMPALKNGDLETFGRIIEDEALTLHALMMASNPSYLLLKPNSVAIIQKIRAFREEQKLPLYFSIDAGPNIHLLYPNDIMDKAYTFITQELAPLCENQLIINDNIGDGPEEI